jgi:hypothetical protein
MVNKKERIEVAQAEADPVLRSPLDLLKLKGGASRRLREGGRPPPDSMLAILPDRATYTFILEDEVASIHFDRRRGEIFFRGHNIRHLELTQAQKEALGHVEEVLKGGEKGRELFPDYAATLARCLADK